jgi:hypothetical protein
LGAQDRNWYTVSVIINEGGGVENIYELSYAPAAKLLEILKEKLNDPLWIAQHQFRPACDAEEKEGIS